MEESRFSVKCFPYNLISVTFNLDIFFGFLHTKFMCVQ